jgi:hypothetical protein
LGRRECLRPHTTLAAPSRKSPSPNVRSRGSRCEAGKAQERSERKKRRPRRPDDADRHGRDDQPTQKFPIQRWITRPPYAPSMKRALWAS